jgi:hypothetical protein
MQRVDIEADAAMELYRLVIVMAGANEFPRR